MKTIDKYDFMSIVGFYGDTAIIDKTLRKRIKKLSLQALLEEGYYKQSIACAVFSDNPEEKQIVLQYFQKQQPIDNFEYLEREFGINISELSKITKIKKI